MSARTSNKIVQVARTVTKVRQASTTSEPSKRSELGREIFIYSHLQTNQVVYSLTRSLKNSSALRQLPYNGKKTVPSALRKDLWSPLACISFSPSLPTAQAATYGQKVFHKLREFRKLHETQWPEEFALDPKTGRPMSRKERGRKLCDQRANSVADMAAALEVVTKAPSTEGVVATVKWADMLDAGFAERWPESVAHDRWEVTRNNRRVPGVEDEVAAADDAVAVAGETATA